MWIVIMEPTLIALQLIKFQEKLKNYGNKKYHNKYLENKSIRFDTVWILLY